MRRSIAMIAADWSAAAPLMLPDGRPFPARAHIASLAQAHTANAELQWPDGDGCVPMCWC